jgi:polyisoprenoid-binding protein YceI
MSTSIPDGTWNFDSTHSSIGFRVKHLGVSTFRGSFPGIEGAITTSDGAVSAITGTVEMASLKMPDDNFTGHLHSDDFFAVATFPQGKFAASSITTAGDGTLTISGEITLRGVTKAITLTGEIEGVGPDPYGNTRIGISATGDLDRTEFGISWNAPLDNGLVAVSERVKLDWHLEAIKA